VRMIRGPWFIASFAGSWRFEQESPDRTRVSFRYHLRSDSRWLSWLLTPLIAWRFGCETRKRLRALKVAIEQGIFPPQHAAPLARC
jgi:hypothetical protein